MLTANLLIDSQPSSLGMNCGWLQGSVDRRRNQVNNGFSILYLMKELTVTNLVQRCNKPVAISLHLVDHCVAILCPQAYAAARFAESCLRALDGDSDVYECAYIQSEVITLLSS